MNSSAYETPLETIHNVDRWFAYDDTHHTMRFIGEHLEARIPKRFDVYKLLEIGDSVTSLGLMDLIIDEKYQATLNLLSLISMMPSDISEMVIDGISYVVLTFKPGDVFMTNTQVVQNATVTYAIWVEFITRGKPLYSLGYEEIASVFDSAKKMTGSGIGVDRVIFELVVSHLARNRDDLFEQLRYADPGTAMQLIALRSVFYAPTSTTSRMIGSYFDEGLTTSLLTHNTQRQPFEDILRGIPFDETSSAEDKK